MLETSMDPQLLHRAASAYYEEDLRQADIADRLGVSRPTVSKLLAEARRIGMVRFTVLEPGVEDVEGLAMRVREALDLEDVRIAHGDQVARGYQGLGELLGDVVRENSLREGEVVLVSSGRTTYAVSGSRALPPLPGVTVVPTVGGQQEPEPWYQTNEIVRRFADATGASPRYLFAPALPSPQLWESLRTDPSFAAITELWSRARMAILGVGGHTSTRRDITSVIPLEHPSLREADGDIALHFFDRFGGSIDFPGSDRLVRLPLELLQRIPSTVAVAAGRQKAQGIIAAATLDLFGTLVTDVPTAHEVLERLEASRRH